MSTSQSRSGIVLELAEEFLDCYRKGQRPALQEYIDRHPSLAAEIREVFTTMAMMEKIAFVEESMAGDPTGDAPVPKAPELDQLGDYRILREVARGGMGVVYEAEQVSLGRLVALKLLPRQMLRDPQQVLRFEREARSAARLHHTNIVPVFGVGEHDGTPYYVMQFIQGRGLDQVLDELRRLQADPASPSSPGPDVVPMVAPGEVSALAVARSLLTGRFGASEDVYFREGPPATATGHTPPATLAAPVTDSDRGRRGCEQVAPSPSAVSILGAGTSGAGCRPAAKRSTYWQCVARIGMQVADALDYAHRQRIVHRDIKPSNLLLDTQGTVWVTDFGLAKASDQKDLTHPGDILGTLRYMAPERFRGGGDARADIYALGLTLYELLTLRPAYESRDRLKLIEEIKTEDPPRPRALDARIPRDLETIVLKAIEKDPDRRYPTADALVEDFRRFLDDEPIRARQTSTPERVWRWCRRKPFVAALVATTATLLVVLAVGAPVAAFWINAERIRADAKAKGELAARKTAETALARVKRTAEESRSRLVRLYINTGTSAAERADYESAMLWYDRAWEADRIDPLREPSHRQRLAAMMARGPQLVGLCAHASPVINAQFDPAGRRVLTRTDESQAYLWDPFRGTLATKPLRHDDRVLHAEFSPDGARVVSCGADRTARLWDSSTGAMLGPALVHPDVVHWAAFSPDGRTLATACADRQVRFWNLPSGTPRDRTIECPAAVLCVVFHPDGARVLTADGSEHCRLWEASTAAPLSPPIPHRMAPGNPFDRLELPPAFSRDGRRFLATHDRTVSLWDLHARVLNRRVMDLVINRVEFDAQGGRVLVVGQSSQAYVLNAASTGLPTLQVITHPREVQEGGFHPAGDRIVTSSSTGTIHVWESQDDRQLVPPFRYFDGNIVASSSAGMIRVWESKGARELIPPFHYL